MRDITDPRWLVAKAGLFVVLGILSSALILLQHPSLRLALLLVVAIWSISRAYYFAFYVIEHYIDPGFKFSGLGSVLRYAAEQRSQRSTTKRTSS